MLKLTATASIGIHDDIVSTGSSEYQAVGAATC